MLILTLYSFLR